MFLNNFNILILKINLIYINKFNIYIYIYYFNIFINKKYFKKQPLSISNTILIAIQSNIINLSPHMSTQ
jgi:hypothetical protein